MLSHITVDFGKPPLFGTSDLFKSVVLDRKSNFEKIEDTKGVIGSRKSTDRPCNVHVKKD
jgi:hypothetical protein